MEYELYHAGVKGMKWGVRNEKSKTGSTSRRRQSENKTITKTAQRKNTTTITSRNGKQK